MGGPGWFTDFLVPCSYASSGDCNLDDSSFVSTKSTVDRDVLSCAQRVKKVGEPSDTLGHDGHLG